MKRIWIILFLILLGFSLLNAQTIDKPVASVRLTETEVINQNQFKKVVELFEINYKRDLTADERKLLLNTLIDEKLIIQAAKKAHIVVTDSEVKAMVDKYIENVSFQINQQITREQFAVLLNKQGKTIKEFEDDVRNKKMAEKYVKKVKKSYFDALKEADNPEIEEYFNSHRKDFTSPEMIRFKHIFINLKALETDAEKKNAKQKAEEILKSLRNGGSFDDYWEIFDDTGQKKIGTMVPAMLRRDDEATKKIFGVEFINKIFNVKEKQISDIITSDVGYHIIFVLDKIPFKILELDDKIPPQNAMTVRNYIKLYLTQLKQVQTLDKAVKETTADLRKEAEIKIWEDNLSW